MCEFLYTVSLQLIYYWQVLHSEKTVGHSKVDSVKEAVTRC